MRGVRFTVIDPNLSDHWMEVHRSGCAHLSRSRRGHRLSEGAWEMEAKSRREAAIEIASDFDDGSGVPESVLAQVYFAPCTAALG